MLGLEDVVEDAIDVNSRSALGLGGLTLFVGIRGILDIDESAVELVSPNAETNSGTLTFPDDLDFTKGLSKPSGRDNRIFLDGRLA